jgi:NAD(P)-dependent dehydrogenase (short-subunit alcohol dehydrogenase family)
MARRLGAAGARVHLGEIDGDRGAAAEKLLRSEGMSARFEPLDVADPDSVVQAIANIGQEGPLYGLVNNAGLADGVGGKEFHEITVEEWDRVMSVNARGTWLMARAVLPGMQAAGRGRIVNIASDAALYGSARLAHYIASKGAVIALTRAMAREVGDKGITVNAVAPGLTVGDSAERVPAERHELYRRNRVINRDQRPEDVVGIVAFLHSEEASYLTGQLIVVDGGFVFH